MKAIRVESPGGPEVLQYKDIPDPVPAEGQALVRIEAIGVNFIDVYHRTGLYKVPLPFTLGQEAAGTVEALGAGVSGLAVGDRVAYTGIMGTYAEKAVVPADRLVKLPEGLSARDGAAVMLQGMTAHYLACSTYPLKPGDTCLVHAAAGGVGLLLCQIAKLRGARVLATTSTEEKARLAREAGADEIIFYDKQDFAAEVRRLTDGQGVQVVYDGVGRTTFDKGLDSLARRGMMVLFGQASGPVPPFDATILNTKGSLYLTRPSLFAYMVTRDELTSRADDVLGWIREGKLKLRIGLELPLREAAKAHRALEGRTTTGKVLLVP
ncbi:MAG TPA: quinone oxidoreductase [Thermoanaerobaculia bacterium]|jgi:NADPH2:quinone reductase|nr:quinone oxidoreductase [Thermoanaerobaculia bacterium]